MTEQKVSLASILALVSSSNVVPAFNVPWLETAVPTIQLHIDGWDLTTALQNADKLGLTINKVFPKGFADTGTDVFVLSLLTPIHVGSAFYDQTPFMVVMYNPKYDTQCVRTFTVNFTIEKIFLSRLFEVSLKSCTDGNAKDDVCLLTYNEFAMSDNWRKPIKNVG